MLLTWSAVGAEIGITGGMAYRVAVQDYEPQKSSIRAALGLPVLAPAHVCPACGVVHVAKRCPATRKPGKPRPTAREQRQRLALELLGSLLA